MASDNKIFLDKGDTLQVAVEKVAEAKAGGIVLNIPRDSVLGSSVHNFQILKRESETAGRDLSIESVDERILELAALAKIPARNPIFKSKERTVTDIVPKSRARTDIAPVRRIDEGEEEPIAEEEEKPLPPARSRKLFRKKERSIPPVPREEPPVEEEPVLEIEEEPKEEPERPRRKKRHRAKFALVFAGFLVLMGGAYAIATYILPQVTINVTLKKTPLDFNDAVLVSASTTEPRSSGASIALPGQLLIAKNSLVMNFPATGTSSISSKATGVLTVYNAYSSEAQVLVATTRFVSPDGHLFRSTERVVVPGAKISGGKLVPSTASVKVAAAEPGAAYNVPPSDNWTIPGFEGTPRYTKFYADAAQAMTGGSDGTTVVATAADVAAAKTKIESALKDSLANQIGILGGDKFKVLPGAVAFATTSESVTSVGSDGNFSVLVSGEMRELVFDEAMLKDQVLALAGADASTTKLDSIDLTYGSTTLAAAQGQIAFKISGNLVYEPAVDVAAVKGEIAGHDAASLRSTIFGITGFEKANIAFWPFWVTTVPQDQSKIELNLD
ncbi:baseplate J/gp47 family protein [Patescibacteria group bacterium]|nr:baseplate J/gp47 family protein [Patescibacteria group bacterium]